jgi:hypothetical protein
MAARAMFEAAWATSGAARARCWGTRSPGRQATVRILAPLRIGCPGARKSRCGVGKYTDSFGLDPKKVVWTKQPSQTLDFSCMWLDVPRPGKVSQDNTKQAYNVGTTAKASHYSCKFHSNTGWNASYWHLDRYRRSVIP